MTVVSMSDYAKGEKTSGKFDAPMCITFFSPKFVGPIGQDQNLNIRITVEDGDVFGLLESVKTQGGIGTVQDERYVYMPWPCACVVIHHPDDDLYGTP